MIFLSITEFYPLACVLMMMKTTLVWFNNQNGQTEQEKSEWNTR